MELEDKQLFTLIEMGIPIWELQKTESQSRSDWIILHAKGDNTKQKEQLLTNMMLAIGVDITTTAIITLNQLQTVTAHKKLANKILLIFGKRLQSILFSKHLDLNYLIPKDHVVNEVGVNIFTTHDLSDLLRHPEKKIDTWHILKLALNTYKKFK